MFSINQDRLVKTFMNLVTVSSPTGKEREFCNYLKLSLENEGFQVIEDDTQKITGYGSGNLIASLEGSKDADPIFFTCHMDTVSPGENIKPSVKDGYIISDGSTILGSDDKAGIAALLEAFKFIKENKLQHRSCQLIFTVGEESGLVGSKNLDKRYLKAKYGFALDSDGSVGRIITSSPAQIGLNIKVIGKAAHAGVNPEDGISAIQVASKAIAKMALGRIDEETTANIGKICGGVASNIVPENVSLVAEVRSLNNEKLNATVENIIKIFKETADIFNAKLEIEKNFLYPSFKLAKDLEVVKHAISGIQAIGLLADVSFSGGGSDANIFNSLGFPTVNLGVGYENIHTTKERIAISELLKLTELVVSLVVNI